MLKMGLFQHAAQTTSPVRPEGVFLRAMCVTETVIAWRARTKLFLAQKVSVLKATARFCVKGRRSASSEKQRKLYLETPTLCLSVLLRLRSAGSGPAVLEAICPYPTIC